MAASVLQGKVPGLPRNSAVFIVVCLAGLLGFALFSLLPSQRALNEADARIRQLELALKKQEVLYPAFQRLYKVLTGKKEKQVSLAPDEPLKRSQIGALPSMIADIAAKSGLQYEQAVPDINSLRKQTDRLLVNVALQGDFFRFQEFLSGLGSLPYLDRIDRITIEAGPPVKSFQLRVWVTMEN